MNSLADSRQAREIFGYGVERKDSQQAEAEPHQDEVELAGTAQGNGRQRLASLISGSDSSPPEFWRPSDCARQFELQADEDDPDQQRLIVYGNTGPCLEDDPNRPFTRIFALADDGYFHLVEMIYGERGEPGGCPLLGSWSAGDD